MTMTSSLRRLCVLPAVLALAALTGCASQITHQDMTPAPVKLAKQHAKSVSVTALPPSSGNLPSAATTTELRTALSEAIAASQAFANVKPEGGDYQLTVQIFNASHPAFGISFTSKVEMGWTLKRADTGAVVWQESIVSEHTTGGTESFSGAERAKMSIVGAIKKNIGTGLTRVASLSL